MRVGINLLPLRPGKNGGMEVYIRNLLKYLSDLDTINEYILITAPYNDNSLNISEKNWRKISIQEEISPLNKIRILFFKLFGKTENRNLSLEKILSSNSIDIWFCPFLSLEPRPINIPSVITLPDIQHVFYPEYFSYAELALRNEYIQPSCEMATAIITISEFSKQTIVDKLYIEPEKIHVIHLAAAELYAKEIDEKKSIIKKYYLPAEYFFIQQIVGRIKIM